MAIKRFFLCLVSLLVVIPANCAPKSKKSDHSPHTLYDQKQTGDYNIQLHLKDFQIIAVLSDDANSLGDYDYDYDYSDLTVKPVTHKPTEVTSPISTPLSVFSSGSPVPEKPFSTIKPSNHPYPILVPSTESPEENEPTKNEVVTEGAATKEPTPKQSVEPSKETVASTTPKTPRKDETSSPGKIKVQIIETPQSVSIVPGEDLHDASENLPQGEILQLKRCASGFSRDKRGRCRRVRRPASPQLQYGFSRLASSLATKLRPTSPDVSSSSSESTED